MSRHVPVMPVCPGMSRYVPACPGMSRHVPACPGISRHVPTCPGNVPACPGMSQYFPPSRGNTSISRYFPVVPGISRHPGELRVFPGDLTTLHPTHLVFSRLVQLRVSPFHLVMGSLHVRLDSVCQTHTHTHTDSYVLFKINQLNEQYATAITHIDQ